MSQTIIDFENSFTGCRFLVDPDAWKKIVADCNDFETPDLFLEKIQDYSRGIGAPGYLAELARLEWQIQKVKNQEVAIQESLDQTIINPSLVLLDFQWTALTTYLSSGTHDTPKPGLEFVAIWKNPTTMKVHVEIASAEDLLILKMISENITAEQVAISGGLPLSALHAAVERAVDKKLIFAPSSCIRRNRPFEAISPYTAEQFQVSQSFTLQLHITQECDLHCRHCYDRSERSALTLPHALKILDDLYSFCQSRKVTGHVSFTGGNPLLHPDFPAIYKAAADHGFTLAVLGNPANRQQIEALQSSQPLHFFQVSLEGLPDYNDYIRGKGHFDRTMTFLMLLRDLNIYSMVMLTLTRDNIQQIIPLGKHLQGKTDAFFFNRLALVGEGASLALPPKEEYISFLEKYLAATKELSVLGLKDNLLNVTMHRKGLEPFGGCTGFGCGAAFNFMSVLPDGEVHACRKFPSLIGSLLTKNIGEIYDSETASRYREGCSECRSCSLNLVCGGCLASTYGHGLDIFKRKDPFCFL